MPSIDLHVGRHPASPCPPGAGWRCEIDPISSASRFDTCSISRSARSASSAVFVPSTTPWVLRSMASTASCGVALNALHDRADVLGRLGGALGEALHFLGHDGEAAPRLARGRRLDRGVQREHVGLLGDVRDELHDLADLLRAFAEALDALGGLLDLLADVVHAADRVLHGLRALLRGVQRALGDLGGFGRRSSRRRSSTAPSAPPSRPVPWISAACLLRRLEQLAGDRLRLAASALVTCCAASLMPVTSRRSSSMV